jgi:hypothetical protein
MTKIYLQNPEKTQIAVFDNQNQIGAGFINWTKLTQKEIDLYLLDQAKQSKAQELKITRDEKNIEPISDFVAKIKKEDGSLGDDTSFLFYTNRHPNNPASDPNAILTGCLALNQSIPYSTRDLQGNKICIFLTPALAKAISVNLVKRNGENYQKYDSLVALINQAKTLQEINKIIWE